MKESVTQGKPISGQNKKCPDASFFSLSAGRYAEENI